MSSHPVFWILLAAVCAPLISEIPLGVRLPALLLEVLLGMVIGPHGLGLVQVDGVVATMFTFGMATTLFMAGMELDFEQIRGRPLTLAVAGWATSVASAALLVLALGRVPALHLPFVVTLALCTTGLAVLIPVFRDAGLLDSNVGRMVLAAGTLGEVGPVVAMSLLLSTQYTTWQEFGLLLAFLALVAVAIVAGLSPRPPALARMIGRTMSSSSQLPVRICLLVLAGMFVLAEQLGIESIFGAFAAGMIVGVSTRGEGGERIRDKLDAICFGWFYPFFFVGAGIRFDAAGLARDPTTALLVPVFLLLFLLVRGAPVVLYRRELPRGERLPLALASSVGSMSIVVAVTEVARSAGSLQANVAAALVGATMIGVVTYSSLAGSLLSRRAPPEPSRATPR